MFSSFYCFLQSKHVSHVKAKIRFLELELRRFNIFSLFLVCSIPGRSYNYSENFVKTRDIRSSKARSFAFTLGITPPFYSSFSRGSKQFFKAAMQYVPGLANLVFCSQCTLLDHHRCFRAVLGNPHRQNRFYIFVKPTSIKYTHCPINEHASQIKNRLKTCFQTNSENNLWDIAALCIHLLCIPRDVFYLQSLRFGHQLIPDDQGRVMKGRYTFQNDFCENDTTVMLKKLSPLKAGVWIGTQNPGGTIPPDFARARIAPRRKEIFPRNFHRSKIYLLGTFLNIKIKISSFGEIYIST